MKEPGIAHSRAVDGGAYCDAVCSLVPDTFTAGSGDDNVFKDGETIDRIARRLPQSMKIAVLLHLVMASGQRATISNVLQDKEVGENFAQYGELPDDVVITANDDGSAIVTTVNLDVDLAGAKQYVRHRTRVNLSASGTDTAAVAATATLFGLESLPV